MAVVAEGEALSASRVWAEQMVDRSLLVEAPMCLLNQDIGSSRLDQVRQWRVESHPPNKSSGRDRCTCGYKWGSASFWASKEVSAYGAGIIGHISFDIYHLSFISEAGGLENDI